MSDEKGKPYRSVIIKLLIIIFFAIFVTIIYSIYNQTSKSRAIDLEIKKLQEEADRISRENSQIKEKIKYFESDDFKVIEAKDKLNLQNPEEKVVVVKPGINEQMEKKIQEKTENNSDTVHEPNYLKWWNYFFQY
jgi:cell division protein FtsB